jgi:hypothetical protein
VLASVGSHAITLTVAHRPQFDVDRLDGVVLDGGFESVQSRRVGDGLAAVPLGAVRGE